MQSAWSSLMTTDSGWMTLGVFLFMLGMGVFFVVFFMRKIRDEESSRRHDASKPSGPKLP